MKQLILTLKQLNRVYLFVAYLQIQTSQLFSHWATSTWLKEGGRTPTDDQSLQAVLLQVRPKLLFGQGLCLLFLNIVIFFLTL